MTLTVAGENYDASKNGNEFTFKNVFIEKSGEFEPVISKEVISGKD
jgi:hypothetical protein